MWQSPVPTCSSPSKVGEANPFLFMWTPTEEDKQHLGEDFFRASRGRFAVEVKWYPAETDAGQFQCRVILDNNEKVPVEEMKTSDPQEMLSWTTRQMKEVAKRS